MKRRVVASIEARMSSTRLPGKVLLVCVGKPMLQLVVERVRRSKLIDSIVIATTTNPADDAIVELARKIKVDCYRGSEEDVVGRVTKAVKKAGADIVVQLTGDNPLVDPDLIDQFIKKFTSGGFDIITNSLIHTYPLGLDIKVASLKVFEKALAIAVDKPHHEHVLLSAIENPDKFKLLNMTAPPKLRRPNYRWTLDTIEDFKLITVIYEHFYPKSPEFTTAEIIEFLDSHPKIVKLNEGVKQKKAR